MTRAGTVPALETRRLTVSYGSRPVLWDVDATFPPGNDSVGLQSISERLESRGGELRIESEPGAGTTLTARLPADPSTGSG